MKVRCTVYSFCRSVDFLTKSKKSAEMLIFCYTTNMRISDFLLLAVVTGLMTYWMNASIIAGNYIWACLYGAIVARNLFYSYKVSRFIRLIEDVTKRKD